MDSKKNGSIIPKVEKLNQSMPDNPVNPDNPITQPNPVEKSYSVITPKKIGRPEPKNIIDINVLLDYARKGYSPTEIGKLVKCSHVNVVNRLKPYSDNLGKVEDYEKTRSFRIANGERLLLDKVTDVVQNPLSKVSLSQAAIAFGILFDKGRLERGQSTQNVSMLARLSDRLEKDDWTSVDDEDDS